MGSATSNEEFLANLRIEFLQESLEMLDQFEVIIINIEKTGDSKQVALFRRNVHSMKGSAMAVELTDMSGMLHTLESKLQTMMQQGRINDFLSFTLEFFDGMRNLVKCHLAGDNPAPNIIELTQKLNDFN